MNPTSLTAYVEGLGFWAPAWPDWPAARAALRGEGTLPATATAPIPAPAMLPPAERRRAPRSVALALAVADEAIRQSTRDPATLQPVFVSAHGDLPIIDELCHTLARTPTLVSPTRFLNSIHNAPAGVWSMVHQNRHAHTALSGAAHSFGQGLLEALTQCVAEQVPVLLVGYDLPAVGALTHTTHSAGTLAVALVLSPHPGPQTVARLDGALSPAQPQPTPPLSQAANRLPRNGMSAALPLMEALAADHPQAVRLALSMHLGLRVHLRPADTL